MSLLNSLTSGVSALDAFSTGLDTVGTDIANVNTTAYKTQDTSFADTFNGIGVQVQGTTSSFAQGALTTTGNPTDLAVSGNGYFIVEDPVTKNQYATRDGQFHIDTTGYLVTANGYQVQGLTGAGLGTLGSIKLGTPPAGTQLQSITIGTSGNFVESYSDGSQATTNQVLLQSFSDQSQLQSEGNNLYGNLSAAGALATPMAALTNTAGAGALGSIQSGALEQSNVDLTQEFANMITMQRAFEANARLVTVSDTVLQDIVNLKQA